jgi:hypothetical protein
MVLTYYIYLGTAIAPLELTPWRTLGTISGSTYLLYLVVRIDINHAR